MHKKLILATRNQDKIKEIKELLGDLDLSIFTLADFPEAPEVVEDGSSLTKNAIKKASVISEFTGLTAVADDTGLEVDYLNGRPGVFSSRYAGENATYAQNVAKLLQELKGIQRVERNARFRCVVALCNKKDARTVEGICEGVIIDHVRGAGGFGYDPVFYVPEYERTFAEMEMALKNRISHRAQAFKALKEKIKTGEFVIN
ncbi:MAG: XTP/dITP diphosphatase [bacterium]